MKEEKDLLQKTDQKKKYYPSNKEIQLLINQANDLTTEEASELLIKFKGNLEEAVLSYYFPEKSVEEKLRSKEKKLIKEEDIYNEEIEDVDKINLFQKILHEKDSIYTKKVPETGDHTLNKVKQFEYVSLSPKNQEYKKEKYSGSPRNFMIQVVRPFLEYQEEKELEEVVKNLDQEKIKDEETNQEEKEFSSLIKGPRELEIPPQNSEDELENQKVKYQQKIIIKLLNHKAASKIKKWGFYQAVLIYLDPKTEDELKLENEVNHQETQNKLATLLLKNTLSNLKNKTPQNQSVYGRAVVVNNWEEISSSIIPE